MIVTYAYNSATGKVATTVGPPVKHESNYEHDGKTGKVKRTDT